MAEAKKTAMYFKGLSEPGHYGDGAGLYLSITGNSRLWMFRYKRDGKGHWMSLGADRDMTLAQARIAAGKARVLLREGIDPINQKRLNKEAAKPVLAKPFETVAEDYIAAHKAGWKNAKHGDQWKATLKAYAYPHFGEKPVDTITVDDVLAALTPIWETKPETASRLRGRIENVLDYAKTRGWRAGENPAAWRGHLDHLLAARSKVARIKHHAALPWADMPAVMGKLANSVGMSALCLRFTILTAARSGEARGARWNEIDLAAKTWTIPGTRMKAGLTHRVPLSDAALAVLAVVTSHKSAADAFVFPGGRKASPLSDVAVSKALAAVADGVTVHGCRSTFRDWVADTTAYSSEIGEAALAHVNGDKTEAAYQRSDLFDRRTRLMREWAAFCTGTAAKSAKVTPIRKRA